MLKKYIKTVVGFFADCCNFTIWVIRKFKNENFKQYIINDVKTKKLIILANGPSLNETIRDLEIKTEEMYCVVNFFGIYDVFNKIKPSLYVLADPLFFNNPQGKYIELWNVINSVNWELRLFAPYSEIGKCKNMINNHFIKLVPYHVIQLKGCSRIKNYLYKKGLTMPLPQNVAIAAIFIGINSGFKNIELYGVDHSWTEDIRVDDNNNVCHVDRHFYDSKSPSLIPWVKIDHVYSMSEILRDLAQMFDSYYELDSYAKYMKCKIFNMTPNSYIDAFKRGK